MDDLDGLCSLWAECLERLARRFLLGILLRPPTAGTDLLAVDQRGAREAAVVRRPFGLEHRVDHLLASPRKLLLELRLEVDVLCCGVVDLLREGRDDRRLDLDRKSVV